jgi:hypothetical protein
MTTAHKRASYLATYIAGSPEPKPPLGNGPSRSVFHGCLKVCPRAYGTNGQDDLGYFVLLLGCLIR